MTSTKKTGRTVGILLLAQMLLGVTVSFVLLARVSAPPGFLVNAAASAMQVRISVLLWLAAAAMTVAIALVMLPILRRHSERMALLYLAVGVLGIATASVENVIVLGMLALSQEYAGSGVTAEFFQDLGAILRAARQGAHYTNVMVGGIGAWILFLIFYRYALVPRALAALGVAGATIQIVAVAMPLLGFGFRTVMLAPIALAFLATVLWLLARGFAEPTPPTLDSPAIE